MGLSEDHSEVPREGEMEAQNQLGVCCVKNKDLNQDSNVATKITSRLGKILYLKYIELGWCSF